MRPLSTGPGAGQLKQWRGATGELKTLKAIVVSSVRPASNIGTNPATAPPTVLMERHVIVAGLRAMGSAAAPAKRNPHIDQPAADR